MDVVEVEDVRCEKVAHELVVKEMRGFVKAHAEPFDVFNEARLRVGCQPHHRVLQKREMPHDPVVGTNRDVEGHLRGERKEKSREVGRHREVAREHRVRKDHVVARRHVVARLALLEAEISRRRYDVEAALRSGKVRTIGLSNFYPDRFVDMAECATVKPAVNQLQTNVFRQQWDAEVEMKPYGTRIMAWGLLAQGNPELIKFLHHYDDQFNPERQR